MQKLMNVIKAGWPDQRSNVSQCIQQFFDFRDTLSYYNGIVGIGEAVVIPMSLRDVLNRKITKRGQFLFHDLPFLHVARSLQESL